MIKIGLIGAGTMGSKHAACYKALAPLGVRVTAVADIRRDKAGAAAALSDASIYDTGMELIENADVDAVDVCLPTYMHAGHAAAAMEKGCAVFVEKPLALNYQEAVRLAETQKKTGATAMVGQVIRFWEEYVWLKEAADEKRYGKLLSAVFKRISAKPVWTWDGWITDWKRSGGAALDLHVHDVDYIRWLLGEPGGVFSVAARNQDGTIAHMFTSYDYGGPAVVAEMGWDFPTCLPFSMEFRVLFERATVAYDSNALPLTVYHANGRAELIELKKEFEDTGGSESNIASLGAYYNELKYFVERLRDGRPVERASFADAAESVKLCLKEVESAGGFYLPPL